MTAHSSQYNRIRTYIQRVNSNEGNGKLIRRMRCGARDSPAPRGTQRQGPVPTLDNKQQMQMQWRNRGYSHLTSSYPIGSFQNLTFDLKNKQTESLTSTDHQHGQKLLKSPTAK